MADETARIDPPPSETFKLATGLELRIIPMQTRQIMRLMRVITHGAGGALLSNALDFNAKPEEFIQKLTYIALLAIPDAEDEAMQFLASMVEPAGILKPRDGEELDDKAQAKNNALWQRVNKDMFNPDPLDTIEVIERIIRQEAEDIQGLGKRLARTFQIFRKTGQTQETAPPPAESLPSPQTLSENSVAPSPPPSTPSAPSTDGPTSTSSPSPFVVSDLSEPPSVPAGQPEPMTAAS